MVAGRAEGAARGRQIKVKVRLTDPSDRLEAETEYKNGDHRDARVPFGQKKKKRRHQQ